MTIVLYACVPVQASDGLFRRVRIRIDGMKVTSISYPSMDMDHRSCNHKPTCHQYISDEEYMGDSEAVRLRPNGVAFNPPRCKQES
jgi:hypothetical protein